MTATVLPAVGTPATIWLYSDAVAAVVTRVSAKSVTVQRVKTDPDSQKRINDDREPYPCFSWEGQVDEPIEGSAPQRFRLVSVAEDGTPRYRNGSISLSLGRSVQVTDYRV